MAEEPAPKARAKKPRPPLWRRRRFWQVVIALEFAVALAVSLLVKGSDDGARPPEGARSVATSHSEWYPAS